MTLVIEFLTLIVGIVIILMCAEFALRSSMRIAGHFRLSHGFVGMTILSIGTSFPEIFTHLAGSLRILGDPSTMDEVSGLVLGTNIGSDIFQQNVMLAVVGLLAVIRVRRPSINRNVGALILAAVLLLLAGLNGFISRLEGAVLFFGYIAYLFYLKRTDRPKQHEHDAMSRASLSGQIFITLLSFVLMGFAAERVLDASLRIIEGIHISASLYGVIILGIAACMPEAITSLAAVRKRQPDIAAGILIGSNVTNPMFAAGLGALISGYTVPGVIIWYDLPVKIATALLIYYFLRNSKALTKPKALVLIGAYIVFIAVRKIFFPVDF